MTHESIVNVQNESEAGAPVGVHSLDHFAYELPDLEQAENFYRDFGLEVRKESEGALGLYTRNHPHRWALITQGPVKRLRYLCFGAYEHDMAAFSERLARANVKRCEPLQPGGLWFLSPDGLPLQIIAAPKSSPDTRTQMTNPEVRLGRPSAVRKGAAPRVEPRRLAHIAVFTASVLDSIGFYRDVLGLRLSDHSRDIIAFMHGRHGSDHHLIALINSEGPGLHHSSWDTASIHDIGLGAQRMIEKGHTVGWGFGRHLLGSNYFYYVRDPWMSYAEYSADIDYIPAGIDWPANDYAPEDAFSLWGPPPPPDFARNFELDVHSTAAD